MSRSKPSSSSPNPSRPAEPQQAPWDSGGSRREETEDEKLPCPPGFGSFLGKYNSELQYGLTSGELSSLHFNLQKLKEFRNKNWEHLEFVERRGACAKLCQKRPDYTGQSRQPPLWCPRVTIGLRPAFCVYITEAPESHGDGGQIGSRGHRSDVGLNAACAALHSFHKLTDQLQGIEPPASILFRIPDSSSLHAWAQTFVKTCQIEERIRAYRLSLVDTGSDQAWLKSTQSRYLGLHLQGFFLATLTERDKKRGFAPEPPESEAQTWFQNNRLQAYAELEPESAVRASADRSPKIKGQLDSGGPTALYGIAAKAFATATAVESATGIIQELLQFTVQGITHFQSRIAPTIVEACGALLSGGHCDFLHRDFTLSIAFVLCLFFKASEAAAHFEATNQGERYTPRQLSKAFEKALYAIFTDQGGAFRQTPGIYPEESAARSSAATFISQVLFEAYNLSAHPVASANLCRAFLVKAIKDRDDSWRAVNQPESENEAALRRTIQTLLANRPELKDKVDEKGFIRLDLVDPDETTFSAELREENLRRIQEVGPSGEEKEEDSALPPSPDVPSPTPERNTGLPSSWA